MGRRMKTNNLLLVTLVGLIALQTTVEQIEAAAFDDLPEEQKEAALAFLRRAVSETDLDPVEIIRRGLDRTIHKGDDRGSYNPTVSRSSEEHPASSVAPAEEAPEDPTATVAELDNLEAAADAEPVAEPAAESAADLQTDNPEPESEPQPEPEAEPTPEAESTPESAPTEKPAATVPVATEPQSVSPEPESEREVEPEPGMTSPPAPVEPEASAPQTPPTERETHNEPAPSAGSVISAPDEPEITSPAGQYEQSNLQGSEAASQVVDDASEHNSVVPDGDLERATGNIGESTMPISTNPPPADPVTYEPTNELEGTDESEGPSSPPELLNNEQTTSGTGITDSVSPAQGELSSTSEVEELQPQSESVYERGVRTESVQEPTQATSKLPNVSPPVAPIPRAISQTMTSSSISTTGGTTRPENSQTTTTSSVTTTDGAALPQDSQDSQTTTTTSSVSTNDGAAMPRDEVSENVYIDNSDPNDPKEVRIKKRRRSRVDANGVSHEHHESRSSTSLRNKPNSYKRRSSRRSSFTRSSSNRNFPKRWSSFGRVPSLAPMTRLHPIPPIPPIPPMPTMPAIPPMPPMPPMMSPFGFPMATTWPSFYGSQDFDDDGYSSFGSGAFASAGAGASAGAFSGFQPGYYAYPNEGYLSKKQAKKMRRKQVKAAQRAANFGF